MITVAIVDDHPIVRAGLRAALGGCDDIQVIGEAGSGAGAIELVEKQHPAVLALDINLPDMDGLQVARQLCARPASPAIVMLTVHQDMQSVFGSLECGALGYVLKDEALEALPHAVRAAAQGTSWLSPAIASQVVRRAVGKPPAPADLPVTAALTRRETEILRLLAAGLDNPAIARRLVLTTRTVQNHVSNLYGKLGVSSRTEAALLAIRCGLVTVKAEDDGGER